MKASDLRKKFMEEHAERVLELYRNRIEGKFDEKCDYGALEDMWNLLDKIICSAKDTDKFEAKTTAEVIAAVSEGKIDIDLAKELMALLKTQSDIEGGTDENKNKSHIPVFVLHKDYVEAQNKEKSE